VKGLAIMVSAAIAVAASSCSGGGSGPSPSPTPSLSPSPSELSSSSPSVAPETFTEGRASAQVAGDVEAEFTARLATPALSGPPPSSFALRWSRGDDSIGMAGPAFRGTEPTSNTLSFVIVAGGTMFRSLAGECQVTIDTATARRLSGSFTCNGLKSQNGTLTVDASGRFSASR
jgi:hypothetical protein